MNIVVIAAYRRPAMLAALLRSIEASPKACFQRYLFAIDREAYRHIEQVIKTFSCQNIGVVRRRHKYPGHTFNVLESLKTACEQLRPTDLVYVLHEDMIISPDFFDFHEAAHKLDPHAAFVSSCEGPRRFFAKDINALVYKAPFTTTRAVSFQSYRLERITDHAHRLYYRDMIGYCAEMLRGSQSIADAEIDGLIRRVFERSTDGYGLYPVMPRASHIGYVGTNHGGQPAIEKLDPSDWQTDSERLMTTTADQLNVLGDSKYHDIDRSPLITEPAILRLV